MAGLKKALAGLGGMKYALLVAVFGLALLLWPSGRGETAEVEAEETRLETLLAQIEGVGELHLLLSEQGAAVVCAGADSADVRLAICQALHCYTGLGSDRIQVFRMKTD